MAKRVPEPVDLHVGSRIRMRRMQIGMPQAALAEPLGLTFQQVQKYEKGVNRVGSSRLHAIAAILEVPVQWFFDGLPEHGDNAIDACDVALRAFVTSRDGLAIVAAFAKLKPAQRAAFAAAIASAVHV